MFTMLSWTNHLGKLLPVQIAKCWNEDVTFISKTAAEVFESSSDVIENRKFYFTKDFLIKYQYSSKSIMTKRDGEI